MVKARKYVVKKYFSGLPKRTDYEVVEHELPALQSGEILVKAEWLSVDPCMRIMNHPDYYNTPYDQFGLQVGSVVQSKNPKYPVGTKVVTNKGWCDYSVVNATNTENVDPLNTGELMDACCYKLPDLKGLPESLGTGAVGMPGATAYFGFLEGCKTKAGETVAVTGAAGAVGSLVGQIAKIKGCKVIGFAGSDEKVKWLENELGFDKAINYKTANVPEELKKAAPNGIDIYYDNVGGEISSQIIYQMNRFGRVLVCGSISSYNEDPSQLPKATILQPPVLTKGITISPVAVWNSYYRWPEAFKQLVEWFKSGQVKAEEDVTEGFDNVFDVFVDMLNGKNRGKAVVKV